MFIPESGQYFHLYNEENGLFKGVVYRCLDVSATTIACEAVAWTPNAQPKSSLYAYSRSKYSFWPVQPGYRELLLNQKFDKGLVPADEKFRAAFVKYKQQRA